MASIINDPNGRKRIQFVARDGSKQTIRLGKVTMRQAETFKVKVESLIGAAITGSMDEETTRWLAGLDDMMYARLAAVDLVAERQSLRLGAWLDKYLASRTDLKPESRRKLEQTKAKLLAFFDATTALRAITPDQASDWRQSLVNQKLSEAAVKTHCGNAKTIFNEAVTRELLTRSPFEHLKSGATASKVERYVTPEEIDAVIAACPDHEWKVLFGLARYAGLRTPSETHLLTWADVDWERARLTVRSPKTEHFAGHEQRMVPVTPKLMKILQDAFAEAEEGQERLVTIRGKGAVIRQVRAVCKRAGVQEWPRLWQTLRSSCEKEWAMAFPQYAVSKWIGHSITISGRHYANSVPDELFSRAAGQGTSQEPSKTEATLKATPQPAESPRGVSQTAKDAESHKANNPAGCGALRDDATICETCSQWSRGELNPRPVTADLPPLHAYPLL